MTVEFRWIDSLDAKVAGEAAELMRVAFSMPPDFGPDAILASSASAFLGLSTIALAAYDLGRLVGFNAFIPFALRRGGDRAVAYQSCWSATHPAFQGRGIWVSMMKEAEAVLAERALFICGIPNPNSHPIMVHKLGYREVPVMHSIMPAVRRVAGGFVDLARIAKPTGWVTDEAAIAKSKGLGQQLVEANADGAYAWGKPVRSRWKRLPVTMLKVGGVNTGDDLRSIYPLIDALAGKRCSVLQFIMAGSHELAPAFRNLAPLSGVRPFVVRDLQTQSTGPLNIMFGITDVF